MESQLVVLLPLAVVWLAAGWLADRLPRATYARDLRRQAGRVLALTATGLVLTATVLVVGLSSGDSSPADRAAAGLGLAAVPAIAVAACAVRRVRRLWAGAGAFAAAPATPAPHGLRAAAAHPLVGLPVQLTGLAILPALAAALAPGMLTGDGATGPAITVGALGVVVIGVRHALRHNRLVERATPPARPGSARPAGALHV
ncbi:hypothetical protein ACN26Y_07270 [Micromonospora sp. WMMD558]|uniref:hypothetical protein n=1 Tax=unclassified Micromonospora TaxID=2617518 RepID=UPI0012B4B21F|nr:hypothetical protein [Micromonospora sp. WMMC415]QGN46096.1 hypothetical protein GKC29_04015 [Micromonospora sp. WMMC415]